VTDPYDIFWRAGARKAMSRLPGKIVFAVTEFVSGPLAQAPHRMGKPLMLGLEGAHSARRGDYRVIYEIDEDEHRVYILFVEHRSDVYRPR